MHQLAVIDGPTAKRRLRHVGATAELRYLAENLVVLHRAGILGSFGGQRWVTATSYHHLPNRERVKCPSGVPDRRVSPATSTAGSSSATLADISKRISSPGGAHARTVLRDCAHGHRAADYRWS